MKVVFFGNHTVGVRALEKLEAISKFRITINQNNSDLWVQKNGSDRYSMGKTFLNI
jgi:hypothetical protein